MPLKSKGQGKNLLPKISFILIPKVHTAPVYPAPLTKLDLNLLLKILYKEGMFKMLLTCGKLSLLFFHCDSSP